MFDAHNNIIDKGFFDSMGAGRKFKWLKIYLDPDSPGYLDPITCTQLAGYKCKSRASFSTIGGRLRLRFYKAIAAHMDAIQSPESLRQTFEELRNAKRIQYFAKDGIVTDEREVAALDIRMGAAKELAKIQAMYERDNKQAAPQVLVMGTLTDAQLIERIQGIIPDVLGRGQTMAIDDVTPIDGNVSG